MRTGTPVKLMICKPRVALARLHVPLGRWAMPVGTGTLDMMHSKSVPLAYCRIRKKYVQNMYIYVHIHTHTSVYIHMTTLQVFLILLLFASVLNWGVQFTPTGHMSKGLCTWVWLTVNIFWNVDGSVVTACLGGVSTAWRIISVLSVQFPLTHRIHVTSSCVDLFVTL